MNTSLPRIAPQVTSTELSPYFKGGSGTRILVDDDRRNILDTMHALAAKPSSEGYHALSMTKAVARLRAGGDLPNAQIKQGRPQRRCLVHSGFEIEYEVVPGVFGQGAIEIVEIRMTANEVKEFQRPGLWEVSASPGRDGASWDVTKWIPDLSSIQTQSALKVGVNGYFKDITTAASNMPSIISKGSARNEAELQKTGYHLFFSPSPSALKAGWQSVMHSGKVLASGNESKNASILAAYMYEAHTKKITIDWTAHRGGSYVLTEAMKLLAKKGIDLEKRQSIYFSDTTTSHATADKYRRKLNMDISEAKWVNSGHGVGQLVGGNLLGLSDIRNGLVVLKKDTALSEIPGKSFQLSNNVAALMAKNNGVQAALSMLISGAAGVSAASAFAVLKIITIAASSVPGLTNKHQASADQALAELMHKSFGRLLGKDK